METTQIPSRYEMMPASRNFAWLPPQQSIICSKGGNMLLMDFVNSAALKVDCVVTRATREKF